jgi:hypothetical protein
VIVRLPGHIPFEISDWLFRTVMSFTPVEEHYLVTPGMPYMSVPIVAIGENTIGDPSAFSERKLAEIFSAFCNGTPLPPLRVVNGKVVQGFHRFYCSAAVGYRAVPILVNTKN